MKANKPVTIRCDPRDYVFEHDSSEYWMPVLGVAIVVGVFILL